MLSSGFANASVSKSLLIYVVVSSIALALFDSKHLAHIQVVPHLWGYGQLWRVFVWQVAGYANSTETLFAAMLVYHLRVIERVWGRRKVATFILTTLPYTTILTPLLLALVIRPLSLGTINYLPSGLTATIFALLAQFHAVIPHTFKYRISTSTTSTSTQSSSTSSASSSPAAPAAATAATPAKKSLTILFSDKSTTYLLAAQLALSQFPFSILPALVGWCVGVAWRVEILPFGSKGWRVPAWMVGEKEVRRTQSSGNNGSSDAERYEDLRRRLEDESRAAAAAAASTSSGVDAGERGRNNGAGPAQGGLLERFRRAF
ncbi:hypothetical protein DTO164E3_4760 [Paecilomyces variotii]|nr:hypothetical protein DTO164E3_4760 [Paecilomyces variotii]